MIKGELKGDHVALLSAFAEMGLKLRMDLPEQEMEVATVFFRNSTPASEAAVSIGFGVKSEELKARLRKLEELAERKAYAELVKDITPKKPNEPFSSYKDQLGFVCVKGIRLRGHAT
ncbi:hypothetical protein SOVF_033750 [Spinacia oleracea]|nr:hypothetical protein SOVF_033750 [Spinacia oleracea]